MTYDHEIARIATSIRNAKRRLPVGARVKPAPALVKMYPRYKGVLGTVVGRLEHGTGASPKVLWDGRRTASTYAPWFILRARRTLTPGADNG